MQAQYSPTRCAKNKQVARPIVSQEWKKAAATCSMVAGGLRSVTVSVWLKKSFFLIYSKYHGIYAVFNWKIQFFQSWNPGIWALPIPGFGMRKTSGIPELQSLHRTQSAPCTTAPTVHWAFTIASPTTGRDIQILSAIIMSLKLFSHFSAK